MEERREGHVATRAGDPRIAPTDKNVLTDKLYTLTYRTDEERPHLIIRNRSVCLECKDKPCLFFCPAQVYTWDAAQKKTIVSYENCVECGACRIGCPFGNILWEYPRGGFGVEYRYG